MVPMIAVVVFSLFQFLNRDLFGATSRALVANVAMWGSIFVNLESRQQQWSTDQRVLAT
jgi:hypothetical protein